MFVLIIKISLLQISSSLFCKLGSLSTTSLHLFWLVFYGTVTLTLFLTSFTILLTFLLLLLLLLPISASSYLSFLVLKTNNVRFGRPSVGKETVELEVLVLVFVIAGYYIWSALLLLLLLFTCSSDVVMELLLNLNTVRVRRFWPGPGGCWDSDKNIG